MTNHYSDSAPIKWWAALGVFSLFCLFYMLTKWVLSGQAVPIAPNFPLTEGHIRHQNILHGLEIIGMIVAVWMVYQWTLKPYFREKRLTTVGLMLLTMPLMMFQDPLTIAFQTWWQWTPLFHNLGGWAEHVPWAINPIAHRNPEPVFFIFFGYIWGFGGAAMIFLWIMRRWKARFSNTPTYGMILVGLICGAIFGFLFELGCIIVGQFWGTFGATAKYSILPDSWQRFSIIECCIMGNIPGWIAISLYFVNDKGETFVERGVDKLKISHSSKGVLRFFAVLALVQMVMFLNYTVPFTTFGLHADKYPADIPVHILNKSCGEGSDYHCPEPGLPIMTKGPGAYIITPDKKLIQK